jgi:cell wall assembly regulator SMI1
MKFQNPFVQKLADLFAQNAEQEATLFNSGATDEQINAFKAAINLPLPDSFFEFYRWHNGSKYTDYHHADFEHGRYLLSLDEIIREKQSWDAHQQSGIFDQWEDGAYWDSAWMPFMRIDYWYVRVVDTKGSFGGKAGQVLDFDYKSSEGRHITHESFDKWLETVSVKYKTGVLFKDFSEIGYDEHQEIFAIEHVVNGEYPFVAELWQRRRKTHPPNPHYPKMVEVIRKGDLARVERLLDEGLAGIDEVDEAEKDQLSPLLLAVETRQWAIAIMLVKRGANLAQEDAYGFNAFTKVTSYYGNYEPNTHQIRLDYLNALLERNVPINFDRLMNLSVDRHDLPVLEFALAHGANANWYNHYGDKRSILHKAVLSADLDSVVALLQYGADMYYRDENGQTALEVINSEPLANLPKYNVVRQQLSTKLASSRKESPDE